MARSSAAGPRFVRAAIMSRLEFFFSASARFRPCVPKAGQGGTSRASPSITPPDVRIGSIFPTNADRLPVKAAGSFWGMLRSCRAPGRCTWRALPAPSVWGCASTPSQARRWDEELEDISLLSSSGPGTRAWYQKRPRGPALPRKGTPRDRLADAAFPYSSRCNASQE